MLFSRYLKQHLLTIETRRRMISERISFVSNERTFRALRVSFLRKTLDLILNFNHRPMNFQVLVMPHKFSDKVKIIKIAYSPKYRGKGTRCQKQRQMKQKKCCLYLQSCTKFDKKFKEAHYEEMHPRDF